MSEDVPPQHECPYSKQDPVTNILWLIYDAQRLSIMLVSVDQVFILSSWYVIVCYIKKIMCRFRPKGEFLSYKVLCIIKDTSISQIEFCRNWKIFSQRISYSKLKMHTHKYM